MLTDAVSLSTNQFVTLSIPSLPLQAPRPISVKEIFSSQIDTSSFNQLTEIAYIYLRLGHYRNQLLHLFVEDAMLALCLAPEVDYGMYLGPCVIECRVVYGVCVCCVDTVVDNFCALHCALTSEFVLPQMSASQVCKKGYLLNFYLLRPHPPGKGSLCRYQLLVLLSHVADVREDYSTLH